MGEDPIQERRIRQFSVTAQIEMCEVCAEGLKEVLDSLVAEGLGGVGQLERGEVGEHRDVRGKLVTELPDLGETQFREVRRVLHEGLDALDVEPRRLGDEKSAEAWP